MVTAGAPALRADRRRCRRADPKAQALYEFMMARRLEAAGDDAGALAALERAQQARSRSPAEISAEIAGYYFRQNRPTDAVAAAEQALKLDKDNVEAHNILGTVYSAWAEGGAPPPPGQTAASTRDAAIEHLTAIQNTPLMATNPNLQMTLGRLQLRAGKADLAVPILEKVAQQAPWAAEPLLLLYEAQISQGKLDEAEQSLVQAAEINPRYFAQLGQFYERQGKWAEAASAYEAGDRRLATAEPRSADALRRGVDQHRTAAARRRARVLQRAAEDQPERHARPLHALDRRAIGGRREGGGSDGAQDHRRSIRPTSPACARSSRCCSIASTTSRSSTW